MTLRIKMESTQPTPVTRLLTYRQAAQYLGLSERKLWGLAASAEIPVCRIGHSVRFDRDDLDVFIQQSKKT